MGKTNKMDNKRLNEIAERLEAQHLPESAKGNQESRDILALVQNYRITSAGENDSNKQSGLHLHSVTLRDELAMHALTGLVSNAQYFNPDKKHEMIVEPRIFERAYSMADGMLKARNGG